MKRVIYSLVVVDSKVLRPEVGTYTEDLLDFDGGVIISNYVGDFEDNLTEYVPPASTQKYKVTLITKTEWRDLLTLSEQILSDKVKGSIEGDLSYLPSIDLESPLVAGITNRDILRTGYTAFGDAESLEVTNPTVQLVTQTMFVVGILATQERVDTILLGMPL